VPPQPQRSPAERKAQLESREDAVRQIKAEKLASELNSVRGQLAASQRKLEQLEAFRMSEKLSLETEVHIRKRAESVMKTRCETAERELQRMRARASKRQQAEARAVAEGEGAAADQRVDERPPTQRDEAAAKARRRRAWDLLITSAVGWSRRVLPAAMACWRVNAAWLRLEEERWMEQAR
jgi:hypothetical protein